MQKQITLLVLAVLLIVLSGGVGYMLGQQKSLSTDVDVEENSEQLSDVVLPEFTEDMSLEDIESVVFETYQNKNVRLVGAVVQDVQEDYLIVKTYEAGPGNSSLVNERKVHVKSGVPIMEIVFEDNPLADSSGTKRSNITLSDIKMGDSINIECAESEGETDLAEFTAVLIIKETIFFDEPEIIEVIDAV